MAVLRALLIALAVVGFFLVGAPLQGLLARRAPGAARLIPLLFCRSLLGLLAVRLVVEGRRAEGRPVLLAANHVSWIDILALGAIEPFCFLAKSEVASWPILSAFAQVQGTVFVDRKRRRLLPKVNREIATRMLAGRAVVLFPEGTTVGPPEPARFLTSHFAAARDALRMDPSHADVAVQPVAIGYSSAAAAWIGDDDLVSHLWRTLRSPPLRCAISFGAPLPFGAGTDRKAVARQARSSIVAMLGRRAVETCPQFTKDGAIAGGDIGRPAATNR